jgi:hypothetical protein
MKHTTLFFCLTALFALPGRSMGSASPSELSLLLVPATPTTIQVARDMTLMGKTLMVSYAVNAPADAPYLHIWDGERWLPVPPDSFAAGSFITKPAARVVVVGDENDQTAFLIEEALAWCPEVLHIRNTSVTELINQLGKVYGLNSAEWRWMAERYQLELEDLNRNLPQSNWYATHGPRDVPRTPPPWKRKQTAEEAPPPSTSLAPIEDAE